MQNYERYSWLVYESEQAANDAIPQLEVLMIKAPEQYEDFRLSPIKNNQTTKQAMGLVPELPSDHLDRDIELCKKLITDVFDPEKEIENSVEKIDKSLEENQVPKEQLLDTLTLYLRQIHGYNFFDGTKCEDERMLASKCGP